MIGVRLYCSTEYESGQLPYLDSFDLNMPLISGETPGYKVYGKADLLTSAGSSAVVQMPEQKFPYVAYPGDRLNRLIKTLERIMKYVRSNNPKAEDALARTISGLNHEQGYYHAICKSTGLNLSYFHATDADNDDAKHLTDEV